MRRFFLCLALCLAAATILPAQERSQPKSDVRPNIVFVLTDDISWNDLGCYGHPTIKTPRLDALAERGLRFTNAYLTTSSCSPSRCSIITGRYPHNTGAPELHTELPAGQVLFPKLLRDSGYYTVLSGKHHMGDYASTAFEKVSAGKGPGKEGDWVQLLKDRPKDRPFFCWFASTDAHRAWQFNEEAPRYEAKDAVVPPYLVDNEATREDLASYYHEVSRTDTYVGKVVDELQRQGEFENTLLIYISDNGRPFPRCKTRLYDSGIKTPMIVTWPNRIKQPAVTSSFMSVIDIAATCLEVAGVAKDSRIQGVSFSAVFTNPKATPREVAFAEHNWHVYQNHERMVRFGDWLYIKNNFPSQANLCKEALIGGAGESLLAAHHAGTTTAPQQMVFRRPCPPEELFRISTDPYQLKNLARSKEHADVLGMARRLLTEWTQTTGDDVPDRPTPDRDARPGGKKPPQFQRGDFPGKAKQASKINHPGPVALSQ